ncbi:MAG: hypothetical protein COA41_11230 [Sphingopyxis sp.]|nr:MAG: hypothetical protein COA41_11230 [Sphingopyxis sp.]
MFGLFTSWARKRQVKELQSFVEQLRSMDGQDLGMILAVATDSRIKLERQGFRLMDPIVDAPTDPGAAVRLNSIIRGLQAEGKFPEAASVMVWLHTIRVGTNIQLRQVAREMWRELTRGMPHVHAASLDLMRSGSKAIFVDGYEQYPAGLAPDPLP